MKICGGRHIRNISVVGHGDSGKTLLATGLLYTAGATNRLTGIDEGNSVADFDEEETQRKITISAALASVAALLTLGAAWTGRPISTAERSQISSYAAGEPMQMAQTGSSPGVQLRTSRPDTPPLKSSPADVTPDQMFVKATKDGNLQTIETLLSAGFDPNAPLRGYGYTPLWHAIECGRPDVVDLLLAAHADPNAKVIPPPFYASPLALALQFDNLRIVSRLISAGADVNAKGNDGRTVLYYAIRKVQLDAMRLLIDTGADVNVRDKGGISPLDEAIRDGPADTLALLLAHGARVNQPNPETGATPINLAASRGNAEIVQFLLGFHPDLGIPDKRGYTPLDNALRSGREDAALLLLEAEPKEQKTTEVLEKALDVAIRKNEPRLLESLLHDGVSANATLQSGITPLDAAVFAGFTAVVRVLLDNGADPNISGQTRTTPLSDASLKGFDSVVTLLLDHGASVNHADADSGATALYAAASFGKGEVVKLLLSRGANPNLCGKNRKSPYEAALDNGYKEVAAEIKLHGGNDSCQ